MEESVRNYTGAKFSKHQNSEHISPSVLHKPLNHWVPVSFKPSDKEIMTCQHTTSFKVQA
ncbi:PREDICTED: proline-rich nuclear receptor coactivator 2-like [Tauraco erythrolophus]|uniref:proline-rich nuclear receptor coactivator 2-like n=1 Tax=Tauraco erythrolophus TaxID=121530 RepID=UPI00052355C7|nr:PREDICTED: proline-rich nuclear receptor coactivator 2-like [Tauraco erythrolophus]